MIKLPRVIGSGKRLHPILLSVTENIIPLSNATMEVMKNEVLPVRTYVELFNVNGSVGIYRTRLPQETHGADTASIQLDHAICEVGDWMVQDAINEESTVREAFVTLFSHYRGGLWQLGAFNATEAVTIDCDYDNLLEQMIGILKQVPMYMMTFDFSTTPWTVSIAKKTDVVNAEGRLSRNIASAVVKRDDKDLCTRVYVKGLPKPAGREDDEDAIGYLDADTQSIYGIVEKETGSGNLTVEQAQRIAETYLAVHKHPKLSVEIDAYDLNEITSEPLDALQIGKLYRLVIPDDGLVIENYITQITWQNVFGDPNRASVTIGDEQDAVLNFLQAQSSSSKSSRRSAKKQQKLDDVFEKNFVKTDEYGAILNQAGMKLDASGMIVYARDNANNIGSILDLTANQLRSTIEAGDAGLRSDIQQTASDIMLSVQDSISGVRASIQVTADSIRSDVAAESSQIYTHVEQTAGGIRTDLVNAQSGLYAYVDETAEYFRQHYQSGTNRVWIQDTDPRNGGASPKVGDIWVESTHQGTWDGAEGFDWEHDEDYDWSQVQGAKIWGWQNGQWELISDQQQVVSMTDVEQTSEHIVQRAIRVMTNDDGNLSVYRAELEVMGNQIRSDVNERIEGVGTSITQTAEQIRSEAHAAQSTIYSEIIQTASSINQKVSNKPIVFVQWEQPTSTAEHALVEGDMWIKTTKKRYWDNVTDLDWSSLDSTFNWSAMKGATIYVYTNGAWVIAMDEMTLASEVDVEETSEHWQATARSITTLEGRAIANEAQLKVEANKIRSYVDNKTDSLGSSITQTATQIRSEVHAVQSTLYSEIVQTASNIMLGVRNTKSDLYAQIEITQDSIVSSVAAAKSTLYTSITQTASAIRIEARNAKSDYYAKIQVASDKIDSSVSAAKSTLYTSIEQTASAIRIEARNAKSDYVARIKVASDKIDSSVAAAKSTLYTSIEQTASAIRIEARNAKSDYVARIKVASDKIDTSVAAAKSTIYTSIEQTASAIRIEARNAKSDYVARIKVASDKIDTSVAAAKSTIYTSIEQTASQIRIEARNAKSDYYAKIQVNSDNISTKVSKNGVISSINQSAEAITIQASKINLSGYVSATGLATAIANLASAHINKLYVDTNIYGPNGGSLYANGVWQLSLTQSGNTYTLTETKLNGDQRTVGTFSRATTLSGQWSGRNYTVTAKQNGVTVGTKTGIVYDTLVTAGDVAYNSSTHFIQQDVIVYSDDGEGEADQVILRQGVPMDASQAYNDGKSSVTPSLSGSWANGVFTVTAAPKNVQILTSLTGSVTRSGRTMTCHPSATINDSPTIYDTGKSMTGTITLNKTEINLTRQKVSTEPTDQDGTFSAITSNGWYVITATVLGQTVKYKVRVNV